MLESIQSSCLLLRQSLAQQPIDDLWYSAVFRVRRVIRNNGTVTDLAPALDGYVLRVGAIATLVSDDSHRADFSNWEQRINNAVNVDPRYSPATMFKVLNSIPLDLRNLSDSLSVAAISFRVHQDFLSKLANWSLGGKDDFSRTLTEADAWVSEYYQSSDIQVGILYHVWHLLNSKLSVVEQKSSALRLAILVAYQLKIDPPNPLYDDIDAPSLCRLAATTGPRLSVKQATEVLFGLSTEYPINSDCLLMLLSAAIRLTNK